MTDLRDKIRTRNQSGDAPKTRGASLKRDVKPTLVGEKSGLLDVNRRLLIAAGAVAGLAALVAVMYLSDLSAGIAGQGTRVAVWVTKKALPARHAIGEDDLAIKEFPKTLLADGYFEKSQDAVGKVTLGPLAKGEALLMVRVVPPGVQTGVAPKLLPNERGFVYIPEGLQEIPLIKPDDVIDLIASLPEPGSNRLISTPVLQQVRVLSVGDRFNSESTESGPLGNAAISLAVPVDKIVLLTTLKQAGNLHFALRAPGDTNDSPARISEIELERLVMGQVPRPVVQRPEPAPRPREVIRTRIIERPAPRPVQAVRPQAPPPAPKPKPRAPHLEIYTGSQKQN